MEKYSIQIEDTTMEVHCTEVEHMDMVALGGTAYHVIHETRGYTVEVLPGSDPKNPCVIVNGNRYTVNIQDAHDLLVKQMGLGTGTAQKINDIKAPMPGLILEINATPGQEIKKDDQLLILSAMKMENMILAPGDGIVKSVLAKEGEAVEKGQVIIALE
ncbi:MAG: acetyl-CoA carboxylase biotin carboxyl carrier protein subunit [Flavobacteriaceae bacterium]